MPARPPSASGTCPRCRWSPPAPRPRPSASPRSTSWPSDSRSLAVFSTASTHAGSTSMSTAAAVVKPIRRPFGIGVELLRVGARLRRRRVGVAEDAALAPLRGSPRYRERTSRRPARRVSPERTSPIKRTLGDALAGRLEADEPVLRGGDADRAATVVRVRHRHHAGGDGRRGAAARAAGRVAGVPRVLRRAVGVGLGRRQDAELGHVGLADRDQAGVAEALGEERVHRRAEVGVFQAPACPGGTAARRRPRRCP